MDPRRLLTFTAAGALLAGCAVLRPPAPLLTPASPETVLTEPAMALPADLTPASPTAGHIEMTTSPTARPYMAAPDADPGPPPLTGRRAIAAANTAARAASRADGFVGGVQVFVWSPGRVFEVWTAPLRVTALTLAPGEILLAKAAGDTVRWQIGETVSGASEGRRTHVLLKPLERGLETNLVLTTNRRVYLIDLKSGDADAFNASVVWDEAPAAVGAMSAADAPVSAAPVVVAAAGRLDDRYRIEPRGRRPRWTPTSVFNDGVRTFIVFEAELQVDEAPALFVISGDGEVQMVNYRQTGGLYVVDRVFDRAELRLGGRRPQVVRIRRLAGDRS